MRKFASICLGMIASFGLWTSEASAGREPAQNALEMRNQNNVQDVVQNRFFLKEGRFELSGIAGYVPNNPMVQRFSGGFLGAYHLNERFAAEVATMYFPDLGPSDLKGLTKKLVEIANSRSSAGSTFEQPLEKMMLGFTAAARWSPIYGKINLIGENVLNFDLYFTGGFGMISTKKYYAFAADDVISLRFQSNEVHPPITAGLGTNIFINQSLAIKLDVRSMIYRAEAPIYDPDQIEAEFRIYNDIITSVGVSYFVPKMKPRLMDF